ncbi:hypothetical protein E3O21_11140 [Cryobacterium flavum]|uniref:AraC-type arabinose-binding/dimerisation domain-containing protein n=1 Tax=Cryobacterium flavum TaxID=1424659 RepID=A0ABY2I0K6_9MICO|nr:hypothetical protein [Cryobacterium flavum]TFB76012.1 hypothetical protein E3O21_11140 [Cryobacterium flavum]
MSQPIVVRRATFMNVTDPVACEELKLVHLVRGSYTIAHKAGQFEMLPGSLALLSADDWYIGTPHRTMETLTLYLDTDYNQDQIRWLPAAAPCLKQALALSSPALQRPQPLHQPKVTRFLHAMTDASVDDVDAALIHLMQLGTLHTLPEHMSVGSARRSRRRQMKVDGLDSTHPPALTPSQNIALLT